MDALTILLVPIISGALCALGISALIRLWTLASKLKKIGSLNTKQDTLPWNHLMAITFNPTHLPGLTPSLLQNNMSNPSDQVPQVAIVITRFPQNHIQEITHIQFPFGIPPFVFNSPPFIAEDKTINESQ